MNTIFPQIMGILNITPDSLSDGGCFISLESALLHAREMIAQGADIIDIGGESTRPNAKPVSVQEELDRIMPVIEKIRAEFPITISVDTSKSQVMEQAIAMGVEIINDVSALRYEGNLHAVAKSLTVKICLMHMQGTPRSMQNNPHYQDVVQEVRDFLQARISACLEAGIDSSRIIIDPGFGFGKTAAHNLQLIKYLEKLTALNYPVLIGVSRKSTIGAVLNKPVNQRLYGSLALTALAVSKGASIIRTHDVAATLDVVKMVQAIVK